MCYRFLALVTQVLPILLCCQQGLSAQLSPSDMQVGELTSTNAPWLPHDPTRSAIEQYDVADALRPCYADHACDALASPVCHQTACCLTDRAFLFGWPGQSSRDFRLNLCEPLITDRPDFTEASSTVGLGVTQLEIGYTYTTDDDGAGRSNVHTYPESLLRYGIYRDWLELRVGYTAATIDTLAIDTTGSADLYLGFKIGMTPQLDWLPEMALLPQMFVPTGSRSLTSDKVLPGLNWLYGWDLSEEFSFAGSTQFNRAVDQTTSTEYTRWAQSLTVGYSLTETVGAYTEWFAFFPDGADTDPTEHYFNGGLTKLFGNNVQWDVRAGMGLNDHAADFFVGSGFSVRIR